MDWLSWFLGFAVGGASVWCWLHLRRYNRELLDERERLIDNAIAEDRMVRHRRAGCGTHPVWMGPKKQHRAATRRAAQLTAWLERTRESRRLARWYELELAAMTPTPAGKSQFGEPHDVTLTSPPTSCGDEAAKFSTPTSSDGPK